MIENTARPVAMLSKAPPPTYMVKVFVNWLNWIGTPSTSVGGVLFEHLSSHTVNECRVHFFIVGTSSASAGEFFLLASTMLCRISPVCARH